MISKKNRVREIESQLESVRHQLSISLTSDNAISRLSQHSLAARQEELERELSVVKRQRGRELVEFRLKGQTVDGGTVPLHVLSKFSHHVGGALLSGFVRAKTGKEPRGPVPDAVLNEANLRLAGIAQGSARLFVVGDSNVDLFGFSLLEEVIARSFEILRNDNEDRTTESVALLGRRSVKNLSHALHDLEFSNLELELGWENSSGVELYWDGRAEIISDTRRRLESMELLEPNIKDYVGVVALLSKSGRIELRTDDGGTIKISYVPNLLSVVSELHLGQVVSLTVSETIARNILTGAEKGSNELVRVNWTRP